MVDFVSSATFYTCSINFWSSESIDIPMVYTEDIVCVRDDAPDMFIRVKHGMKMQEIPSALEKWIEKKLYCRPNVGIQTVAKEIGINHNYLSRYFNGVLGTNFQQCLHTLRIEEAKHIMAEDPKIKLYTVANSVGIPKVYNFSRWFKIITGVNALAWRNELHQSKIRINEAH